ncbi:ribbon-helix-helix domain-containing protein [Acidobacteria bacterium AH-259-A15]|nr:ribbon-helix-helix domain-containing protein [Acidobacteria bacterium AH-259-A15]
MHRTQLLIEDWQYESLRSLAERRGSSISELVREMLQEYLTAGPSKPKNRLAEIRGIGRDPRARGRDHDLYLYGLKKKPE